VILARGRGTAVNPVAAQHGKRVEVANRFERGNDFQNRIDADYIAVPKRAEFDEVPINPNEITFHD